MNDVISWICAEGENRRPSSSTNPPLPSSPCVAGTTPTPHVARYRSTPVHGVRHCPVLLCEGEQRGRGDPSRSTAALHRRPLLLPLLRLFLADEEEQRKELAEHNPAATVDTRS
nr:hypothetical protein Iba_scaffold7104CG0010 [Ipomoea batatas]